MKVFGFPGQGSQFRGMGRDLFKQFKEHTEIADHILGYSIEDLCVSDPNRCLTKTEYTQPALYTVNILSYLAASKSGSVLPDYFLGHSLGEYCALYAAGAFSFEDGLRMVQKRGQLMSCAPEGAMAACLGINAETINGILKSNGFNNIEVANFNAPEQIVLSGTKDDIFAAAKLFENAGARYIPLNVSAAFHSKLMDPVTEEFVQFLNQFTYSPLKVPVIANVTARMYPDGQIPTLLQKQISGSVQWTDSIRYLMGKGEFEFQEFGPGDVLSKLVKQINSSCTPLRDESSLREGIVLTPRHSEITNVDAVKSTPISSGKLHNSGQQLGSASFRKDYNLKYAYLAGAMYKGIASADLVIRMGKAGLMGFLGTGGLTNDTIEAALMQIQRSLPNGESYGVNLLHQPGNATGELALIDLYVKYGVKFIEASAFMQITPALVKFRLSGIYQDANGKVDSKHKIIAKLSRPEMAKAFLSPAPDRIVKQLLAEGLITEEQARLASALPVAEDICAESDSGGHTDSAVASILLPTIKRIRDELHTKFNYQKPIRVGAAGGVGTPESVAAMFVLGADFVVTGSINQCTVEAGTSDLVKDMLQCMDIQDTDYAPAGDMFELGAKVQVLRRGVFFPGRAKKLHELWSRLNSLDEIDANTRKLIEEKYFRRSFNDVYAETKQFYLKVNPAEIDKAETNPKHKMALIFKWYFVNSTRLALSGGETQKVDFQIHTGPAMGAFNHWAKGTDFEQWRNRHVDHIGVKLMDEAADYLNNFSSAS
ncbi:Polyketide biosynthesis protein BaeE [Pseudoalteromonas holothuriae]|uniref:[acyl-carrier-protein] S-malonyltransferase n=1 Tax=Pseudoalteromonas holothuriae TaxID=2963714 RepID=A0A9W4W7R2_9GAMM|nr:MULTISPECIES: ACP S-malonyltransferase [unclassified Pseudoalteromonas]CAH9066896.1 Polyketide biosynthesis protein BaeE [Pseudoalteromonas sp. CIP111854]CAH9068053.1 Polyketide biosynthesis protein BaeE [Pseudoalteromonas sp. CIP111951]